MGETSTLSLWSFPPAEHVFDCFCISATDRFEDGASMLPKKTWAYHVNGYDVLLNVSIHHVSCFLLKTFVSLLNQSSIRP